jgi:SAM-dependent methyltransferase
MVESHLRKIEWVSSCGTSFKSVANFGCNIRHETAALAWCLGASEAIGIDKDMDGIRQGLSELKHYRDDLKEMGWLLPHETDPQIRSLIERLRARTIPSFVVGDVRGSTGLRSDIFDLSYCERVLYQVFCGDADSGADHALRAIREISRVTKPGGLVVAIEPTVCSARNSAAVELDCLFSRAGLVEFTGCDRVFSAQRRRTYVYAQAG